MGYWIEGNATALKSKRSHAFEAMFHWLQDREEFASRLPDVDGPDLVVELSAADELPGGGVGVQVIYDSKLGLWHALDRGLLRGFPDMYLVRIAMGRKRTEAYVEYWHARLTTLPHELLHVADWYGKYGATPLQVAMRPDAAEVFEAQALAVAAEHAPGAPDPEEQEARGLTGLFLEEHPEYARWI
jgi:hypothetical protein